MPRQCRVMHAAMHDGGNFKVKMFPSTVEQSLFLVRHSKHDQIMHKYTCE